MISLVSVFHSRVSGRLVRGLLQHLCSLAAGGKLNRKKAHSQFVTYSCRKRVAMLVPWRGENTNRSRRNPTTSVTDGRRAGSCRQHLTVISHTESVRPSSRVPSGRAGRSPVVIFKMMIGSVKPLNG